MYVLGAFFLLLTGILPPDTGHVLFEERDITRMPIHRRAQLGFALTHQIVRPFREMTLAENVMMAAAGKVTVRPWKALVAVNARRERERALGLLERFVQFPTDRVNGSVRANDGGK